MQKPTHLTISGIEIKVLRGISQKLKITVSRSTGRHGHGAMGTGG
jgi:hypothetical protein